MSAADDYLREARDAIVSARRDLEAAPGIPNEVVSEALVNLAHAQDVLGRLWSGAYDVLGAPDLAAWAPNVVDSALERARRPLERALTEEAAG